MGTARALVAESGSCLALVNGALFAWNSCRTLHATAESQTWASIRRGKPCCSGRVYSLTQQLRLLKGSERCERHMEVTWVLKEESSCPRIRTFARWFDMFSGDGVIVDDYLG